MVTTQFLTCYNPNIPPIIGVVYLATQFLTIYKKILKHPSILVVKLFKRIDLHYSKWRKTKYFNPEKSVNGIGEACFCLKKRLASYRGSFALFDFPLKLVHLLN